MPLSPGDRLGPYEILGPIGKGGMGEVYRAHDSRLNRDVAIKTSSAQFTDRFAREARSIAALNHTNICHLYDVGPDYLVMEYVEGQDLQGPLSFEDALPIIRQLIDGIEAAHEKNLIHRDLKPANIKITPEGVVKILDFGLAKAMDAPHSADGNPENSPTLTVSATQAGTILGTAAYMAPEQAKGKAADRRSDIWSFGVIVHELLTGRRLFPGETAVEILGGVLNREPDLGAAPPQARKLLAWCLEKDRKQRLASISDARRLLTEEPSPVASPSLAPRSSPLLWIATAALALVAVTASWIAWKNTRPHEQTAARLDLDLGPYRNSRSAYGPDVVLSPDGTRMAFIAQNRLFIRQLDQPLPTELPGTGGATDPVFSPDNQTLAFAAGGQLKKVSVAGSSPVTLANNVLMQGASWGDDGSIVGSLNLSAALSRIPAAGGPPVPLTTLDLARGERAHRWPQILPGGKAVLFTSSLSSVGGFDEASIEVVTLSDGRRKKLFSGGTFGRYIASANGPGYLTYVNRGTLFAVPFDLQALEVRGSAVPILDHVAYSTIGGAAKLDVSQNGTVLYENGDSASSLLTLQWLEQSGATRPILSRPGNYGRPSISPDGRKLALEFLDGTNQDIWVQDLERDVLTRLTFDGKGILAPLWTPDGRFILFQDPRGIAWTRADGSSKPQLLLPTPRTVFPWSFTPDGKTLSYMVTSGTYDLWQAPLDQADGSLHAGKPESILATAFDERYPALSPDGHWLAYTSNESGSYQIYVRAYPEAGSGGGKWQVSSEGGSYPMWSRTAHQLFYEDIDARIMVATYSIQGSSFSPEKPKLWSDRRISNQVFTSKNLDLAPDGKRFAVLLPVDEPSAGRSRFTLIQNFPAELRKHFSR